MSTFLHFATFMGTGAVAGGATVIAAAPAVAVPNASKYTIIAAVVTGAFQLINNILLNRKLKKNGISQQK